MPRRVEEWIGKDDDEAIPERVKRRVIRAAGDICGNCGVRVRVGNGDVDHKAAVIKGIGNNSGLNRESNLQYLCKLCHRAKTAEDVNEKATSDRKFSHVYGITKSKGRSFNYRKKPKPKPGYWEPYDFDDLGVPKRSRWVAPDKD
jgi:5-methylcytosine-specific restriction protein A